jgi:long-chain acyl-CoA synthetase
MTPDPDAPAKILFTSGTTGINKGVVLTGANLTANMNNCQDVVEAWEDHNVSMSVLPMHHSAEINTHIMTRIGCGRLTCICPDVRRMMPSLKIFQPSTITVVPMIAQAFYKSIWAGARKNGKAEKLAKGIRLANLLRKFGFEISHKLFPEVFAPFGGHLKMIICGGAMVNPVVVKGMADLGIRIENGYGITECGPLISMNADPRKEHLSVGKPCPNLETRIDQPDENGVGELCVRGRNVSSGYYKDPEATALVFDPDGWFHTGDMARIAADGRIFLMGRLKNTIVLSNGKNVNPEELENLIETRLEYVDECVVYPARLEKSDQEFIVAGLYISDESRRADRSAVAADVAALNATLSSYKRLEYVELPATDYPKNAMRKILRKGLPTVISEGALEIV